VPSADQFVARLPAPARRDLVEWEKRRPREYATAILARERPAVQAYLITTSFLVSLYEPA